MAARLYEVTPGVIEYEFVVVPPFDSDSTVALANSNGLAGGVGSPKHSEGDLFIERIQRPSWNVAHSMGEGSEVISFKVFRKV